VPLGIWLRGPQTFRLVESPVIHGNDPIRSDVLALVSWRRIFRCPPSTLQGRAAFGAVGYGNEHVEKIEHLAAPVSDLFGPFLMRIKKPLGLKVSVTRGRKNAPEKITMLTPVQLFLFASLPFISIADSVPKFDIAAECRSEGGSNAVLARCAEQEAAARDQLPQLWTQSSAADKATCVGETMIDGTPSYVELMTCLEMSREAKMSPK